MPPAFICIGFMLILHFVLIIYLLGKLKKGGIISCIAVPVVLVTDGLTRSRMTTTYHLRISGGVLSVVVIAERCYGPCRLSDNNNNN